MKTILHVLPYLAEGGTEKHVLTIMRRLHRAYNLVLLAPRGKVLEEFLKLNIHYVEFPVIRGNVAKKIAVYKRRLGQINRDLSVDIVHIHAAHELGIFTRRVLPHVPIIFHLSAYQGNRISRMVCYKLSAVVSRRNAEVLIAVSEQEKRKIVQNGFPSPRVRVVYNGYEEQEGDDFEVIGEMEKKYGLEGSLVIGNVGRLNRTKRLDLLISGFSLLKKKINSGSPSLKLLLVGEGPETARLRKLAEQKGLKKDVIFPGFVSRGDRVLKIFDIFVLPTTFEGCSNVLVEAMAKKLPIITTDIPSVKWMFQNGENALLFKKNRASDLCGKMHVLVRNENFRKKLGENIYKRYKQDFTAEKMVKKIDEIYQELLCR